MNSQSYYNPNVTLPTVLCCVCGLPINPNSANMCVPCLRSKIDISEEIPRQSYINFCRGCQRYNIPPSHWVTAELESPQLLAILLKRVKGLSKVRLVDASFVWTEPHSKRIKVKLIIEKAVFSSTVLQHSFVVEFVVMPSFCEDCHQGAAKDHWNAVVQLRQKVKHKKTFYYLEQLILKHRAHVRTINIKERPDGLDFYYSTRNDAIKMVDFLQSVAPVRLKLSERLMSTDLQSNTANFKHTYSVEIVPICKDDFICLPAKLARSSGNISQVLLCLRVGTSLKLIDPNTLQLAEVTNEKYWKEPFSAICSYGDLLEFVVLDVEPVSTRGKFALADVQCVRARDLGRASGSFFTRTHLGNLLRPGDSCLGYDLTSLNTNNSDFESLDHCQLLPVLLVKKHYPYRRKNRRSRKWKLKTLDKEIECTNQFEQDKASAAFESFLQDVEEDRELRSTINIFKNLHFNSDDCAVRNEEDEGEEDFPEPSIEEMLDELTLEDDPLCPIPN
jgi:nonsense-mediated mRNA decay protein 3